jgi:16S rRNA (guanine966-N2)-methyltransferase
MRIIAGEFKGHTIKVPKSNLVRPTTDKTKESIFNYLSNMIDFDNLKVLDLYAGSGALGFEAISRGAAEVHFVEKNYHVYKNLIGNIEFLKVSDRTKIFKLSCVKFSSMKENNFLNENGILLIERSVQTKENDVKNFDIEPIKKLGDSLIYQFDFS